MKTKGKALLLALCAVILVVASVFGTLAYLTDTKEVVNTFTVGKVKIALDEKNVDNDTVTDAENNESTPDRDNGNEYHLIPGSTYTKDPTVTVEAGSEEAYVRMKVKVENIDQLEAALPDKDNTAKYYAEYNNERIFLLQNLCVNKDGNLTWDGNTWLFEGFTSSTETQTVGGENVTVECGTYEFRYVGNKTDENNTPLKNGIVAKKDEATVLPALFTAITVPGADVTNENIGNFAKVKIIVSAEAIQAEGFADAKAAWTAFTDN